ncbi:ABC transporter permease [Candidatus Acetothermia bacterium]|nr:MAG: ABC transporter permease [Candidatus Acetothermia bacterium]
MKAYLALLYAVTKQFYRDRMALFWMFAFPVLFVLLFGFVFGGSDELHLRLGVVAPAGDPVATGLLAGLEGLPMVEVSHGDLSAELSALEGGDRDGVLVLPQGLSSALSRGERAVVELYYDAAQGNTARILLAVVDQFLGEAERRQAGVSRSFVLVRKPIQAREFRPIDYMLPGVVAMALMQLGLFGVAATLLQMRERKILRRFWATPVPRATFIGAQVTQRVGIALLQAGIITVVGHFVFSVPILGAPALMAGVVILGALTFVSLGYFIASLSRTVEAGSALMQVVNFPMMFLSGIFWPVEWMPGFLRPVIYALPLTYLGDALRQAMVRASPMFPLWVDLAVLGAWLSLCGLFSVWLFKWE